MAGHPMHLGRPQLDSSMTSPTNAAVEAGEGDERKEGRKGSEAWPQKLPPLSSPVAAAPVSAGHSRLSGHHLPSPPLPCLNTCLPRLELLDMSDSWGLLHFASPRHTHWDAHGYIAYRLAYLSLQLAPLTCQF